VLQELQAKDSQEVQDFIMVVLIFQVGAAEVLPQ
jgi:hypothetical protein